MDLQGSWAASFQFWFYSQECTLVGGFHPESWSCCLKKTVLTLLSCLALLQTFSTALKTFPWESEASCSTAVQPRLGPWVLTLSPADQDRFYLALLQPRCVRQDLSETLALPQPSSCSSAELPDEHVWSYCIMKSSEREEKYTKTEKYNSEGTTEKNSPFPQVNTQPQMGGLLVRVKHCHTLLPVITIINPTWPAKLQGHTLIFPIMFSWLPREALQQRRASKFHLQWQECI